MGFPILVTGVDTGWAVVGGGVATKTTAPVTRASGDFFVLFTASEGNQNGLQVPLTIAAGAGAGASGDLTWTSRQESTTNSTNTDAYARAWTAPCSVTGSTTFGISRPNTVGASQNFGAMAIEFNNATGIGNSVLARGDSAAPTVNITTTQPNSAIAIINVDWQAADGASRVWRTGAGPVRELLYHRNSSAYTVYIGVHTGVANTGVYAVGLSSPGGQSYDIIAVEIFGNNASSGGGGGSGENEVGDFLSNVVSNFVIAANIDRTSINRLEFNSHSQPTSNINRATQSVLGVDSNLSTRQSCSWAGRTTINANSSADTSAAMNWGGRFTISETSALGTVSAVNRQGAASLNNGSNTQLNGGLTQLSSFAVNGATNTRFDATKLILGVVNLNGISHLGANGGLGLSSPIILLLNSHVGTSSSIDRRGSIVMNSDSHMFSRVGSEIVGNIVLESRGHYGILGGLASTSNLAFVTISNLANSAALSSRGNITFNGISHLRSLGGVSYEGAFEFPAGVQIGDYIWIDRQSALYLESMTNQATTARVAQTTSFADSAATDIYINTLAVSLELGQIDFSAVSSMLLNSAVARSSLFGLQGIGHLGTSAAATHPGSFNVQGASNFYGIGGLLQQSNLGLSCATNLANTANRGIGGILVFSADSYDSIVSAVNRTTAFSPGGISDLYMNTLASIQDLGEFALGGQGIMLFAPTTIKGGLFDIGGRGNTVFSSTSAKSSVFAVDAQVSMLDAAAVTHGGLFAVGGQGTSLFAPTIIKDGLFILDGRTNTLFGGSRSIGGVFSVGANAHHEMVQIRVIRSSIVVLNGQTYLRFDTESLVPEPFNKVVTFLLPITMGTLFELGE